MIELGPEVGVFRSARRALVPLYLLPGIATAPMVVRRILFAEGLPLIAALGLVALIPASVLLMVLSIEPLLRLFPVRVYELGLRGHGAAGRPVAIAWYQVSRVDARTLLWLDYLRVTTSDPNTTIWLPRFLADQSTFDALVLQHAGAANPLSLQLEPARPRRRS